MDTEPAFADSGEEISPIRRDGAAVSGMSGPRGCPHGSPRRRASCFCSPGFPTRGTQPPVERETAVPHR